MPKKKGGKSNRKKKEGSSGSQVIASSALPPSATNSNERYTPESLIAQANVALSNVQIELAGEFYARALGVSPNDTDIMDALADIKIQIGEMDAAKLLLEKSVALAPERNPYKWLFLAQLESGKQSVSLYETGIRLLSALLSISVEGQMAEPELFSLRRQIAKAHCSIAELYMTDLCYEVEAEDTCEAQVLASLAVLPDNLDALQTQASLRLSQQRTEDAAVVMHAVYERLSHIRKVVAARTIAEEMRGEPEPMEFQESPEMDFCIAAAKLLIECGTASPSHSTLVAKALDLLEDLIGEDDEIIEIWYLIGVAALSSNPVDTDCAKYHLEHAKEMIEKLKEATIEAGEITSQTFPFEDQYDLICQHLEIVQQQQAQVQSAGGSNSGNGNTVQPMDEEWSDDENEEAE